MEENHGKPQTWWLEGGGHSLFHQISCFLTGSLDWPADFQLHLAEPQGSLVSP
jgi:hypothetical protein